MRAGWCLLASLALSAGSCVSERSALAPAAATETAPPSEAASTSPQAAAAPDHPAADSAQAASTSPQPAAASAAPAQAAQARLFETGVLPLLEEKCSPCHFPGGKMHDRLPFERPETIRTLGTLLFTRLKSEDDQAIIRSFLESPASPAGGVLLDPGTPR